MSFIEFLAIVTFTVGGIFALVSRASAKAQGRRDLLPFQPFVSHIEALCDLEESTRTAGAQQAVLNQFLSSYNHNRRCFRAKIASGEWILLDFAAEELVFELPDRPVGYDWLVENTSFPYPPDTYSARYSDAPVTPEARPYGPRLHVSLRSLDVERIQEGLDHAASLARALQEIDLDEALAGWYARFMAGQDPPHPDDAKALKLLAKRGESEAVQKLCARVHANREHISVELCLEAIRHTPNAPPHDADALATAWFVLKRTDVANVLRVVAIDALAGRGDATTANALLAWNAGQAPDSVISEAIDEAVMKLSYRHGSVRHQEGQVSLIEAHGAGQLSLPASDGALSLDPEAPAAKANAEADQDAYEVVSS